MQHLEASPESGGNPDSSFTIWIVVAGSDSDTREISARSALRVVRRYHYSMQGGMMDGSVVGERVANLA